MRLVSIQIGLPQDILVDGKTVSTGIFKNRVEEPVRAHALGIEGDGQADLRHHGGTDKAVYAFGLDAYETWKEITGASKHEDGLFGENLTFDSLDETKMKIGDTFVLGTCVLQVAEPRIPCFKLNIRVGSSNGVNHFIKLNRPGVYFRVLQEGTFKAGDILKFHHTDASNTAGLTVAHLFQIRLSPKSFEMETEKLQSCLDIKSLSDNWKASIHNRLKL